LVTDPGGGADLVVEVEAFVIEWVVVSQISTLRESTAGVEGAR